MIRVQFPVSSEDLRPQTSMGVCTRVHIPKYRHMHIHIIIMIKSINLLALGRVRFFG